MVQTIKNYYHLLKALIANIWYGFPSKELIVIGVTGTDGKTTTTSLIYHILRSSGKKVAMITSIGATIDGKLYDIGFHVTTPSSFAVQRYIRQAVMKHCEYVVLETTSHALDQYRTWGTRYEIAALTNITHEHLDYHKTIDEYLTIKLRLFHWAKMSVLPKSSTYFHTLISRLIGKKIITYSVGDAKADVTPFSFPFTTPLLGRFNKENCLAAIAVCGNLGISDINIRKALKIFVAPAGRQEIVYKKEFTVMIDFAHTPNAFSVILPEIKNLTHGRLIHVFGSAGKRDRTKRPMMGKESGKSADIIILTAEDPRDEPTENICEQIASGMPKSWKLNKRATPNVVEGRKIKDKIYFIIPDRKEAIMFAINLARKGDYVVFTGKAHEKSMNYGHGEEPWNEFEVVQSALHTRNTTHHGTT